MSTFSSPFGEIETSGLTITQRVFQGLADRDRDAMIDGPTGRRVTAGELVDGTRALAGGLRQRGIGPGRAVAIMLPNLPEYFACFHGTAWAGATVTTVNPTYTAAELHHQLTDAGAEILITLPAFAETAIAGAEGTRVREIFALGDAAGTAPFSELMGPPLVQQVPVDVENDTLVLPYSSGTTGLPKGVMLTHRNLVANVDQTNHARPIAAEEWTVGFLPFFHIYGMTVLMNLYLAAGAGVVTMPRFDLELFLKLLQDHRTKQVFVVPPVALALAKHPLVDNYDLSSLQYVFSGAAPLGAPLSNAVEARLGVRCEQGYGMTEMSPVSHLSARMRGRPGSAGQTAPSTECRIVDPETGSDLGVGEVGELWVRGPQVMKGYLNNAEATAATLVPGGWLRTGDIAAYDEDGYLFIHDRLKELIKVKGFQVAPAEVEAELQSCPGVADAAVIGVPDDEAGEVPVAFLVRAPGATVDADQVAAHLSARLAHYKLPRTIHFVGAIPKSASGKILRRMLRAELTG
ncbi:AMP-binding protein [Defluviimonas sp. WL0002]|uniref:AMP-binding protein n=1 Tax=Albidovulum marisflavi TaxID=2984159 RepID=A0ABT2Z9S6_9RHOB|nr:AMP-binding protein [Defluviimonas sp. WL0002]MCV2867884.1 AMP-binding protein [Defluviimonas sp. WL0002]